jgi:6-pyruvoyltetrahydropterin/6-carboxytetrahydropterin synthase
VEIFKEFTFEAAHYLPNVPGGHKCGRIHGHSYRVKVFVQGSVNEHTGWVIDFADIYKAFQRIDDQLDHSFLNEIEGLSNPTAENIAQWIWERMKPVLPQLTKLVLRETEDCGCIYQGEDD